MLQEQVDAEGNALPHLPPHPAPGIDKQKGPSAVEPDHGSTRHGELQGRLSQDLRHHSCSHGQAQRNQENSEKDRARISILSYV